MFTAIIVMLLHFAIKVFLVKSMCSMFLGVVSHYELLLHFLSYFFSYQSPPFVNKVVCFPLHLLVRGMTITLGQMTTIQEGFLVYKKVNLQLTRRPVFSIDAD